jgi:hypothetical protein
VIGKAIVHDRHFGAAVGVATKFDIPRDLCLRTRGGRRKRYEQRGKSHKVSC